MMVNIAFRQVDPSAEFSQAAFEALRRGSPADGADERVAQTLERQSFARQNILQIERLMRALDDLGGAIVTPDALDKRVVRLAGVFGDEDVAGAPEISRRLAQRAARKQELISKGRLSIHQHHVEPMFEMQILQAVAEQGGIDVP